MSENEPRALADLARALEAAGWTVRDDGMDGDGFYATLPEDGTQSDPDAYHWIRLASWGISIDVSVTPNLWPALDIIKAWQAPPSPDAGAVERIAERIYLNLAPHIDESVEPREPSWSDLSEIAKDIWRDAAKAALLAFAPGVRITPTISEADVEAGKELTFRWLEAWSIPYPNDTTEFVRALHEAVAAARQRATGSGVTR